MIFKTVENNPNSKISLGKVLLALMALDALVIVGLVVAAYLPQNYRTKDTLLQMTFTFNIVMIILVLLCALYYVFFRAKRKSYVGTAAFKEDVIELNGESFPLAEIKHLRFMGNDIRGEFRGFASKGTDNQVFITKGDGAVISSYFEQSTENNLKQAEKILEFYKQKGILTEANLDNILNNTNYY